ncbi:MAG: TonB family protein [Candidatus Omnitrophota bacterium]|nr:MAG: TonB family protein [Candidatus Omnitrophota bacterium]
MKKLVSKIFILVLGVGCLFSFAKGYSQEYWVIDEKELGVEKEITLMIGEAMPMPVSGLKRVSITNPEIADLPTATADTVVLVGVAKGRTTFTYEDETGPHTYYVRVIPEDIDYLYNRVQNVIKSLRLDGVRVEPLEEEGKVFILGTVDTVDDKERITEALGDLAEKTTNLIDIAEEALVEIVVEVLELSRDAVKELGIDWPGGTSISEQAARWPNFQNLPDAFMRIFDWGRTPYSAVSVDWLIQQGKAELLSRPRVVCQSGKEAELLVGGEVPVFTTTVAGTTGAEGTQVEYKEFGIKLNIGPTVKEGERIQLALDVEISEVGEAETIGDPAAPSAKAFPINTRNISTQLFLNNGETLAIGGLIKKKSSEDLKKLPWLADIPIIGRFFTHTTRSTGGGSGQRGDTELYITLTPRIIKPTLPPKAMVVEKKKKEFLRAVRGDRVSEDLKDYILDIQSKILRNITYPTELINTGWEGQLVLRVSLSSIGELKDVIIVRSSGYKLFDDNTIKLVKSFSYPPFPSSVRLGELNIDIPVVYQGSE